jgi:hypothetical protein
MEKLNQICFPQNTFNIYLFLLFITIFFVSYYIICLIKNKNSENNNLDLIQLIQQQQDTQQLQLQLQQQNNNNNNNNNNNIAEKIFLNKIYNPLSGTSPLNPQGSFSTPSPSYDGYRQFQMLGYLTGSDGRYPVMGRYRDAGRSDRFEYYTIDNERGRIKIPFKNKNYKELYDGDSINIDELGGEFTFKKYEDQDGNRYDPNVIY